MAATSQLTYANFFNENRIAHLCETIDPNWKDEPFSSETEKNCVERLNKLAVETIQCGALLFPKVRFRREVNKREQVLLTPLCIGNNPKCTSAVVNKFGLFEETIIPLSQKEIDFYLLNENKIYHIQMSSTSDILAQLDAPKEVSNYVWDTSTSKINEMVKQDWSNCFVTAQYCWDHVIPLPKSGQ